jgi:hypothetical protein
LRIQFFRKSLSIFEHQFITQKITEAITEGIHEILFRAEIRCQSLQKIESSIFQGMTLDGMKGSRRNKKN